VARYGPTLCTGRPITACSGLPWLSCKKDDGREEDELVRARPAGLGAASRGKRKLRVLRSCWQSGLASGGSTAARNDGGWRGFRRRRRGRKAKYGGSGDLFIEGRGRTGGWRSREALQLVGFTGERAKARGGHGGRRRQAGMAARCSSPVHYCSRATLLRVLQITFKL